MAAGSLTIEAHAHKHIIGNPTWVMLPSCLFLIVDLQLLSSAGNNQKNVMKELQPSVLLPSKPSQGVEDLKKANTWQSVRAHVLGRIQAREWAPGELIPTEQQLATQLGCARATINRALRDLASDGLIERRRKAGTRVTMKPLRRTTLEIPPMREEIEAMGAQYSYRLLGFRPADASPREREALHLGPDDDLLMVSGQYLADTTPHFCETVWLNRRALPALHRVDLEGQPAHEWLARNVAVTQRHFSIQAKAACNENAANLAVQIGTPVLAIERVHWSDTTPVSISRQFYPPKHRLVSGN